MEYLKTIKKLKGETDRVSMSLYLSKSVYEDFKKACDGVSSSRVLEELMREFVESYEKENPLPKKISKKKSSSEKL